MNEAEGVQAHEEQVAYWNTDGGAKWIAAQAHTDAVLAPVLSILLKRADIAPGQSVLDIGCGCGATTVAIAHAVGASGRVVGLDVSRPMLGRAQEQLKGMRQASTLHADASTHRFEPLADLAISRFGVMFFGDPVAAFRNLKASLKQGGKLVFACWRGLNENPWMKVPLAAVYAAGVPPLPRPEPEQPGPFSFADPERVRRILNGAGYLAIEMTPFDLTLDIAAGQGLDAATQQAVTIGAAARALHDEAETLQTIARDTVRQALQPFCRADRVELGAAIWIVEASPS